MKISKLFHYLYAAIMFLPLLVLPVFMIYSHRHDMTQQTEVDIQYKYQTNEVNSLNDLVEGNIYRFNFNGSYINNIFPNESGCIVFKPLSPINISYILLDDSTVDFDNFKDLVLYIDGDGSFIYLYFSYEQYLGYDYSAAYIYNNTFLNDFDALLYYFEPDVDTSASFFSSSDFNVIESVDVQDSNSSIMDVTINSFNETINKYFNMRNVFNLNQLYNWLNVNVFNGVSAVSFNILFNLFAYWLFVSLLWLMFDVFMYVPLLVHNMIDKARIE